MRQMFHQAAQGAELTADSLTRALLGCAEKRG